MRRVFREQGGGKESDDGLEGRRPVAAPRAPRDGRGAQTAALARVGKRAREQDRRIRRRAREMRVARRQHGQWTRRIIHRCQKFRARLAKERLRPRAARKRFLVCLHHPRARGDLQRATGVGWGHNLRKSSVAG